MIYEYEKAKIHKHLSTPRLFKQFVNISVSANDAIAGKKRKQKKQNKKNFTVQDEIGIGNAGLAESFTF